MLFDYFTNSFQLGRQQPVYLEYDFENPALCPREPEEATNEASLPSESSEAASERPQSCESGLPASSHEDQKNVLSSNKQLSGMLEHLLSMSRQMFQNKGLAVDGGAPFCICGKGTLKSPRSSNLASIKSPRGAVPRSPGFGGLRPSLEKLKPNSAKRILCSDGVGEAGGMACGEPSSHSSVSKVTDI